jgi:hypothetical protein
MFMTMVGASACSLLPSEAPVSRSPEPAPSTSPSGSLCGRDPREGNPQLVGWLSAKLAAVFRSGPCLLDPATNDWAPFGPRTSGRFATDGSGLAGTGAAGILTVIDSEQHATDVSLPTSASDWESRGSQISPLVCGGYLLDLLPELVRVSVTGAVTEGAIPSGFLVAAPTTRGDTFILRPDVRTDSPDFRSAPFAASLWTVGDKEPSQLLGSVIDIRAAHTPALAWLADSSGGWWQVDAAGAPTKQLKAAPSWIDEPSPTGEFFVELTDRSQGCEHNTPPSCAVNLIERSTGAVLASSRVGSNSPFIWSESGVAFVPTTSDPVGQPAATQIVMLSPDGVSLLPLP